MEIDGKFKLELSKNEVEAVKFALGRLSGRDYVDYGKEHLRSCGDQMHTDIKKFLGDD